MGGWQVNTAATSTLNCRRDAPGETRDSNRDRDVTIIRLAPAPRACFLSSGPRRAACDHADWAERLELLFRVPTDTRPGRRRGA